MEKTLFRTFTILLICFLLVGGVVPEQTYAQSAILSVNSSSSIMQPQSDIIEWVYKFIGGKLYKRQYNYTQEKWIGDWIRV